MSEELEPRNGDISRAYVLLRVALNLDLSMIDRECMNLDVSGHYARPDVFTFSHAVINQR